MMSKRIGKVSVSSWLVITLLVTVGMVSVVFAQAKDAKYMGVEKCKNCHNSEKKGDQYGIWKETKHAKAYETLAGEEAKKIAKEKGIDDPQKSDKCLKCHVTAFNEPDAKKDDKFDPKLGIQCEACHGPASVHVKARLAAAAEEESDDLFGDTGGSDERIDIPDGEVDAKPTEENCKKCHNSESPTFKEFKFDERYEEIKHPDPRNKK